MSIKEKREYIQEAIKGSKQAFSKLYKDYANFVYKKCYFVTLNQEEALDLFQTIWLKCYLNIKNLKKIDSFQFWFNSLINHVIIDYIRQKRQNFSFCEEDIYESFELENKIVAKLSLEKIFKILTEEERAIIQMYFMDGLTAKEIAQFKSCSISAIKMRIHRAIKKIKKILIIK